jgi:hypothetical protein
MRATCKKLEEAMQYLVKRQIIRRMADGSVYVGYALIIPSVVLGQKRFHSRERGAICAFAWECSGYSLTRRCYEKRCVDTSTA